MARIKNKNREIAKKYFSIEEAEKLLASIGRILNRTVKINKALDLLSSIEIEVYDDDYNNIRRVTKLNKQFHKLSYEFYSKIERIEDMGGVIRDFDIGVVDFYSNYCGKEIFLSWKLGEKKIKFWHEVDSDYAGRMPIVDLINRVDF